jgi:hypothetical protein
LPNTIKLLREIQQIDLRIDALSKEEAQYRESLEGSGEELGAMSAEVETLEAEVAVLTTQKNEKTEMVRQNKERIERDQVRLSEIKNDKQYKAVNKEISNAEKSNKLLGMEIDSLSDRTTEKAELLAEKQGVFEEKNTSLESMKEGLAEKEGQWTGARDGFDAERAAVAKDIEPRILKRYERVKAGSGGIGIANVKDETCLGCYIHIPPQTYIHLLRGGSDIIDCPHCHRILYYAAQTEETPAGEDSDAQEASTETAAEPAPETTPEAASEEATPEEITAD